MRFGCEVYSHEISAIATGVQGQSPWLPESFGIIFGLKTLPWISSQFLCKCNTKDLFFPLEPSWSDLLLYSVVWTTLLAFEICGWGWKKFVQVVQLFAKKGFCWWNNPVFVGVVLIRIKTFLNSWKGWTIHYLQTLPPVCLVAMPWGRGWFFPEVKLW